MTNSNQSAGAAQREGVMAALATVMDPDLKKDLVSLNMIEEVGIDGARVGVKVKLTTPACPLKELIARDIKAAVGKVADVQEVEVTFSASVAGRAAAKDDLAPGVRNIIGVASGKGGVGKSTVALNLALALAREGASVGLLDADIYGPNIPTMVGIKDQPRVVDNKMIPHEKFGIKLISMGFLIEEGTPVIWRGPMLNSALRQFFGDVAWGDLDYLIVDLPPGTGDVQISMVQLVKVTGCVIVTTPQEVSLQDARRGLAMFHQTDTPVLGIIENMAWFRCEECGQIHHIFGEGGGKEVARRLGVPFLGAIPLGIPVREGGDTGRPIVDADPECEQSRLFGEIARQLAAAISVHNLAGDSE